MGVPMSCDAKEAANARRRSGINAWRYRFFAEFPNTEIAPGSGAWHGIEEFAVFGTAEFLTKVPETPEQIELGKKVREAWSTFAKDPQNGLIKLGWPVYDDNKPTLIKIGGKNSSSISFVLPTQYDTLCGILNGLAGLLAGGRGKAGKGKGSSGLAGLFTGGEGRSGKGANE